MNKRFILRIVNISVVITILLVFIIRCTPPGDIRYEAMNAFIPLYETGIDQIDVELNNIDEQRYSMEVSLLKLEQVVTPALEWLEFQETQNFKTGNWLVNITPEGLARLKNDQYSAIKVEFFINDVGTPYQDISSTIMVTDLTKGTTNNWEDVKFNLEYTKSSREKQWRETLKYRELSTTTINNLVKNWQNWEVRNINQTIYEINGIGLGWDDRLVVGSWTYNQDNKELIPLDEPGRALRKVLIPDL
jgi:hypothetical protein